MNCCRYSSKLSAVSAADDYFKKDKWSGWQFGLLNFDMNNDEFIKFIKGVSMRLDKYKKENIKFSSAKIEIHDESVEIDCYKCVNNNTDPSQDDILFIKCFEKYKTICFIANHAYCDGIILYDILSIILNLKEPIRLPKYTRIPIISEIMIFEYVLRNFYNFITVSTLPITNINNRYSIKLPLDNRKRWGVYGKTFEILYEHLDCSVTNLRFAFTVAWDDDQELINNRIGIIILNIPRLNSEKEYSKYIENKFMEYKYDALTSYELIKSYDITKIRNNFKNFVDGVFTGFLLKDNVKKFNTSLGCFVGNNDKAFYINVMTGCNQLPIPSFLISIQSCTSLFNGEKFLKQYDSLDHTNLFT